ncbi:hypothetical protein QUB05_06125 [Microcoleus sp. F10-C6]
MIKKAIPSSVGEVLSSFAITQARPNLSFACPNFSSIVSLLGFLDRSTNISALVNYVFAIVASGVF